MLYALGVAQVALDDLVRELMVEAAEGGDSAARLSNAFAAGRELTIKDRATAEELAGFDRVKDSLADPFVAKARTTAMADQLGAALLDADPWADDDTRGHTDLEDNDGSEH